MLGEREQMVYMMGDSGWWVEGTTREQEGLGGGRC